MIFDYISNPPIHIKGEKTDEGKLPLGIVIQKQFPNALKAVAKCSQYGHDKYKHDLDWLNYQRVDDWHNRYLNASIRHLLSPGNDEESNLPHVHHALWNLLALVEKIELEKIKEPNSILNISKRFPNDKEFGEAIRKLIS